jgi:hypothetical protein
MLTDQLDSFPGSKCLHCHAFRQYRYSRSKILADEGYHCEYYGKWHSLSSHTNIYKNPLRAAKNGNSVFYHGGQKFVWLDYIRDKEPARALKAGEFYDKMLERPYKKGDFLKSSGILQLTKIELFS